MTSLLFGFSIGGLMASVSPLAVLLLSPFILLLSLSRKEFFYVSFACLLGITWVSVWWFDQVQSSVKESEGVSRVMLMGDIQNIRHQSFRTQFDFEADEGRYLVSCYRCPYEFESGQVWQFKLSIKPFHSLQNPNGFDYRKWMLSKGYKAQASIRVKAAENQMILTASQFSLRSKMSQHLTPNIFPILRALLLGDKSNMSAQQKRLVNGAGLSHLFVVSGLHIGMVAFSVTLVFIWLQRPLVLMGWKYGAILALMFGCLFAGFYSYLSGLNTPALRSLIMLILAAIFVCWRRQVSPVYYLLMALFFVLLVTPLSFFDMGSWLSFSIVGALVLGFYGKGRVGFINSVLISQLIAFCVGGVVLLVFNQPVSVFGLVANLFLVPLMSIFIMPLALIGLLLSFNQYGWELLQLLETGLSQFIALLGMTQNWSQFSLPVHDENRWIWMVVLTLGLFAKYFKIWPILVVLTCVALVVPANRPEHGGFKVTVLDVGQGSSALVQTNWHSVLVDTGVGYDGSFTMVDFAVKPLLRREGIDALDLLHVTHDDQDHAGGVSQLAHLSHQVVTQGDCDNLTWKWDGVTFERFQSSAYQEGNNGSCLLRVSSMNGQSILFSGDIERQAEMALLAEHPEMLAADVLVVPHHGSRTSSSNAFINHVNPTTALISAGFLNRYHHPHEKIIRRYEDRSVKIYSTASQGAIEVVFSPRQENHIVSTYRPNLAYE